MAVAFLSNFLTRECLGVQRTVCSTQCPIEDLEKQSIHLLQSTSDVACRNRAAGLCQAFSVSRFDEIRQWKLGGMHMTTCSSRLPTMGECTMRVVCFVQMIHKTGVVRHCIEAASRITLCFQAQEIPDEKHVVRRKEWLLCPQGALARYLFRRFVVKGEIMPCLGHKEG